MKTYKLFLLSVLYILFSCVCFDARVDAAVNAQGVRGQRVTAQRSSGTDVQDAACQGGKKAGDNCTALGSKEAKCEHIRIRARDKSTTLSCVVKSCRVNDGFLLELDNNGRSRGICRKLSFAKGQCEKIKNKPTCGVGQELLPEPIANPNYPEKDPSGAYKDCFCADTSMLTYACGDGGTGTAPTDNTPYTNIASVTLKDNTCTKTGYSFTHWSCGGKSRNVGEKFTIDHPVQCVAQWKEDTKCPNDASGKYPDCNCTGGKEYVEDENTCKCPEGTIEKDRQCVVPTQCPKDATGTYPDCNCTGGKEYDKDTNTCQCPNGTTEQDGKCVVPTQCPSDATGTYPDCTCKDTEKTYDKNTNTCNCPDDKPANSEGVCVAPVQQECPSDASGTYPDCTCNDTDKKYDNTKNECVIDELKKKQQAYDEAKAKEQSLENRALTAATTAATGIGTMELLQGLAEQSADKDAMADMAAYIQTMRCTYGNGQQVKAGPEEIELPGANDTELMNLRGQYMSLAADLKERKEALGMKPGIESEVIMDRTQTGLYDDENIGITGGNYASIYRAMMLNSEADQAKIDDAKNTSGNRVKYGATAAGAGVAGGIVGNELINGKLGEKSKSQNSTPETEKQKTTDETNEKDTISNLVKKAKDLIK